MSSMIWAPFFSFSSSAVGRYSLPKSPSMRPLAFQILPGSLASCSSLIRSARSFVLVKDVKILGRRFEMGIAALIEQGKIARP